MGLFAQQVTGIKKAFLVDVIAKTGIFRIVLEQIAKPLLSQTERLGHRFQCQVGVGEEMGLVHFLV